MHTLRLTVANLQQESAQRFEDAVLSVAGVVRADTWRGKAEIIVRETAVIPAVVAAAESAGFELRSDALDPAPTAGEPSGAGAAVRVKIDGMTCHSCEVTVERKLRKIPGVSRVEADSAKGTAVVVCKDGCLTPDIEQMNRALQGHDYAVRSFIRGEQTERPPLSRVVGLIVLVLALGALASKLGFLQQNFEVGSGTGFWSALVIGLVAGGSSCLAVSGGLLLSSAAKFNERYGRATPLARLRPVGLFIAGRIVSYALFGGIIAALGKSLSPSPSVTGAIMILAAVYMIVAGLDMLKIAPAWMKNLMPRLPKSISHRVLDAEGKEHPAAPLLLGGGTFFIPCGFTQALQLYALTAGSFAAGALVLGGFALGTAPALLALGWASGSLKGKMGQWFFQFSGALVVVLGLWNVRNGLTIAGYSAALPSFGSWENAAAAERPDPALPPVVAGKQTIKMTVGGTEAAYEPDTFTVRAGLPVRWEITAARSGGCLSGLISSKLGVRTLLQRGENVVEFTPPAPGTYSFSCSMGMFRGTINVVD